MTILKDTFSGLARRFADWRAQHRAYAELSALDDHALADLGLRRSDIPYVVFCKARTADEPALRRPANSNAKRHIAD